MGLFSSNDKTFADKHNPRAARRDELKRAQRELDRIGRRDRKESADYRRANKRVADAAKNVSWWSRG